MVVNTVYQENKAMAQNAATTKPAQMTPQQIDTELARLYHAMARPEGTISWLLEKAGERAKRAEQAGTRVHQPETLLDKWERQDLAKARAEMAKLLAEAKPYEAQYAARQWNRYYLVINGNGHVHRERTCSTCYARTRYNWVYSLSGCDEAVAVAEYGEKMCTVCFPDAPTTYQSILARGGRSKVAIEEQAKKDARQARKDELAAKRAAKAIFNPDGTPLVGERWRIETVNRAKEELQTAVGFILHNRWEEGPEKAAAVAKHGAVADRIAVALAHKLGGVAADIRAEAERKVQRRGY